MAWPHFLIASKFNGFYAYFSFQPVRTIPMINSDDLKKEAEKYISFEKNKESKIAYLTINRPDRLNATSAGMRLVYADYVYKANIDDEVKVLVIRGAGEHFGAGGDLPEQAGMHSGGDENASMLHEFEIDDPEVKYPP